MDVAYIAMKANGELQLSCGGTIPTSFVGLALNEKNGWETGVVEQQTVYTHKQTNYQLCLPSPTNAFLSHDNLRMIKKFNQIAYADGTSSEKLLSEVMSERNYKFLHENNSADIVLYSSNPLFFIKSFLSGVDVHTSITSIYAVLSQYRGVKPQFNVKLVLNLADARTVKATVALIKVGFFGAGIPAKVVQSGQNQITISDMPVTQTQILSLLD